MDVEGSPTALNADAVAETPNGVCAPTHLLLFHLDAKKRDRITQALAGIPAAVYRVAHADAQADALPLLAQGPVDLVLVGATSVDALPRRELSLIQSTAPAAAIVLVTDTSSTSPPPRQGVHACIGAEEIGPVALKWVLRFAMERKQDTDQLLAGESRYRNLYENIPSMYFTLDANGTILSANAYGVDHLGYRRAELVGHSVLDIFHADDREQVKAQLAEAIARPGETANWEFRKLCKDGRVIWVEEAVRVVSDGTGSLLILVACEDITERKLADARFANQSRMVQSILDSIGDGVVVADREGQFLHFNPAARRIMGQGPKDVVASSWPDEYALYHPDGVTRMSPHKDPLSLAIRGHSVDQMEILTRNALTEEEVIISVTGRPLRDHEGRLTGGVVVFRDITAARRLQQESQRLAARLLDVQENERRKISATLHDELGQLLTLARLDIASSPPAGEAHQRNLESAARRLDEALASVRKIAVSLRPTLLDDLGLLAAMDCLGEEFSESSGIPVSIELSDQYPPLDLQCETCLYRVLQEALTNISKHAHASAVSIALRRQDQNVQLEISDNGRGFGQSQDPAHAGIGLIGMRERVSRLGGGLSVETAPGQGTTICATLPLRLKLQTRPAP